MPTSLSLDSDLVEQALRVSGERSREAAVSKALREFVARRDRRRILELLGTLDWDESFDYRTERSRR